MAESSSHKPRSQRNVMKFIDAKVEREAAEEAEKREDWDAALLHYENIYDSARIGPDEWDELREKMKELRPKVAPNTDESKAGHFKVRIYIFRHLDVKWTDDEGVERRCQKSYDDDEIEVILKSFDEFAALVREHSWGYLMLDKEVRILDETLTDYDMLPDARHCMPYFTDLEIGDVDCLFVFAKLRRWPEDDEEKDPNTIPTRYLAGILPVLANTRGALYISFNMYHSWGVMIHEFLHGVGCALDGHQGYPQGIMGNPDNITDCFGLLQYYATRKMLRELSIINRTSNPWVDQYCREFLVTESFSIEGLPDQGIDEPFIDETSVKPSENGKWQRVPVYGYFLDLLRQYGEGQNRLAYAALTIVSEKDQNVELRLGIDDAFKVWQDGRLILCSPTGGGASPDRTKVGIHLKEGPNEFLLKLSNFKGAWRTMFRVSDYNGRPLPDVQYALPGEAE